MRLWQLVINGPGYLDAVYDLPEGVTRVGRADDNDIVLVGTLVSRQHATIHVRSNEIVGNAPPGRLTTRVNQRAFGGERILSEGEIIEIDGNRLELRRMLWSDAVEPSTSLGSRVRRFGGAGEISPAIIARIRANPTLVTTATDGALPALISPRAQDSSDSLQRSHPTSTQSPESNPLGASALAMLLQVSHAANCAQSVTELLERSSNAFLRATGSISSVFFFHSRRGLVPALVCSGRGPGGDEVPVANAILDLTLSSGQALAVATSSAGPFQHLGSQGIEQVFSIPVGNESPPQGIMYLNRFALDEDSTERLLDVCAAAAAMIALGVKRLGVVLNKNVDMVSRGDGGVSPSGLSVRNATLLSVEISNFEALLSPAVTDRLGQNLDRLMRLVNETVALYEGSVVSCQGDSALAIFEASSNQRDDGIRAVRAALMLRRQWTSETSTTDDDSRTTLRFGIDTGSIADRPATASDLGDRVVVGAPVRNARYLRDRAQPGQILATGKLLAILEARFDATPLGERPIQKNVRTAVFDILDEDITAVEAL